MGDKICKENKARVKPSKRVVYFCDGSVECNDGSDCEEEINTDGDDADRRIGILKGNLIVDPSSLHWMDWICYRTKSFGSHTLGICDYLGERLSSFFGITTPKYQFEINHFNNTKKMDTVEIVDSELGSGFASKDANTSQHTMA